MAVWRTLINRWGICMVAHHTPPFIIEATNGYGKQGLKSLEYHAILLKFN